MIFTNAQAIWGTVETPRKFLDGTDVTAYGSRRVVTTLEMAVSSDTKLRLGSSLVAVSYALAGFAAYSILSTQPDMNTRPGRHLLAGALAIGTLSAVEVLIAVFPLRRGERWAFWTALLPLLSLVLPVMLIDATHVTSGHLGVTLTPFSVGLILAMGGLALVGSQPKK